MSLQNIYLQQCIYIFSWYIGKSEIYFIFYLTSLKCMLQMEGVLHLLEEAYMGLVFLFFISHASKYYTIYVHAITV